MIPHAANGDYRLYRREEEARKAIDLAIHYAAALQCPAIHVMAGVTEGFDRQQCADTFVDNVRYAADRAKPHNITILLEGLSPATRPGYLFSSQYQAMEYILQQTATIFGCSLIFSMPSRSMAI